MPHHESSYEPASRMERGEAGDYVNQDEKHFAMPNPSTCGESTLAPNSPTTSQSPVSALKDWCNDLRAKAALTTPKQPLKETRIRKLEEFPVGYPRLAAFADSDECFMIYRRFGHIHSRLLLHLQDELRELEADLYDMDKRDDKNGEESRRCLQSRDLDVDRELVEEQELAQGRTLAPGRKSRTDLLQRIERKALQYGQLLLQAQQLVAMNKPPMRDQMSLRNYMQNRPCLVEDEASFVYEKADLITLRPGRDHSIVDAFVERMLGMFHCKPLQYIFCSHETASKSADPDIRYFTRDRISICVTLTITLIILLLLVVPIWLLFHLSVTLSTSRSNVVCIGVLLVSTLIFSAVLSLFTKARRHEILAASAG